MRKLLLASVASMGALVAATGGAKAQPLPNKIPAPGTIVVHMNGYLQFEFGVLGTNAMSGGTVAAGTAYKLNSIGTAGDVRIYPGFDAQTVNGIDYGAQLEFRTTTSNAGKGVNGNAANGNGAGNIYVRRAYGYIGTPDAGYARFGQTDGAFTLLQTGLVENFGDGAQWTSDGGAFTLLPNRTPGNFIYADQGALYTTDKIVYLTPAFTDPLGGGLSGAVSFEPSSNGIKEGFASAASDLGNEDDSIAGSSSTRRKNTIDGMVMYALKMDGFANKFSVGYLHSSPLGDIGAPQPYDDMGVFQVGGQTTFMGFTVGANLKSGQVEDGYAFKPKGGRDGLAYIIGGSYTMGPYVVGASFYDEQTAGSWTTATKKTTERTLDEYGVAVGGNYVVAKPLSLFVQYLYGHEHQKGNSSLSASGNGQAQVLAAGATIKW